MAHHSALFRYRHVARNLQWKGRFGGLRQSCKSGRAFRVGFGPGSGLKLKKILGLIRAWDVLFGLGAQKYNQNNLATLLNFSDLTSLSLFFGHDLSFKLAFGFGSGSGLYFRVRAGFGPELVGPFTTLVWGRSTQRSKILFFFIKIT